MLEKESNLLAIEEQVFLLENNALEEERNNAQNTYQLLSEKYKSVYFPHPEVSMGATSWFVEEFIDLQLKKAENKPSIASQSKLKEYLDNPRIHVGHMKPFEGMEIFFMDSPQLESIKLEFPSYSIRLVNVDDKLFSNFVHMWRFPAQHKIVSYSRNIEMEDFQVSTVDVVLDRSSETLAGITDAYLRKALIRNKEKSGIQSIIQTIQQKQDELRLLPANQSFVVQGCAGSGKTMVLLHRLRYLLFNNDIKQDDFLLLVPSNHFMKFIKDLAFKFRINNSSIIPIQSYYRMLLDKSSVDSEMDVSELVFDNDYLSRIYSEDFMKECYREFLKHVVLQTEELISFCDDALQKTCQKRASEYSYREGIFLADVLLEAKRIARPLDKYMDTEFDDFTKIKTFIDHLASNYEEVKKAYVAVTATKLEIVISADDKRILEDINLKQLTTDIQKERKQIDHASIFTVHAHKTKLAKLEALYAERIEIIKRNIVEEEKALLMKQAEELQYVFGDVTLEKTEEILHRLKMLNYEAGKRLDYLHQKKHDVDSDVANEYHNEIEALNQLIVHSSGFAKQNDELIENLFPCREKLRWLIDTGSRLLASFIERLSEEEQEKVTANLKLYYWKSKQQLEATLYKMLFGICRKKVRKEFNIRLCDIYKHYWYLAAHCKFLVCENRFERKHYLFIDEAQDLSTAELSLIRKINTEDGVDGYTPESFPVMNVFGDVNQMITTHGISTWKSLSYIANIYNLRENFRNTNQIIEYCNNRFIVQMEKVGVDMDEVSEFEKYYEIEKMRDDTVFVVKDDYALYDLECLLKEHGHEMYSIYTVKTVKGLEFQSVCVFDRRMSSNERYIAYTRALSKLYVIHELPYRANQDEVLYVEGDENETAS